MCCISLECEVVRSGEKFPYFLRSLSFDHVDHPSHPEIPVSASTMSVTHPGEGFVRYVQKRLDLEIVG